MSEQLMKQYVTKQTEKKFRGRDKLYSKHLPQYPKSAEREYIRAVNAYMKMLREVLQEELPTIKEAYLEEMHRADARNIHFDKMTSLATIINRTFARMEQTMLEKEKGYGLRKIIEDVGNLSSKQSIRDWKITVRTTLGVDITDDYYMGDFFKQALGDWIAENVDLIVTIPKNTLGKMREIALECYQNGTMTTEMMKQIQREYGVSKRHSRLLARDQVAKLSGQIAKAQQQDAGIEEYIWWCVNDGRSRKAHKDLHNKVCKWSDPPEVAPGRHCHPGGDYQCRCIARPIFKRNSVSIPVKDISSSI